MTKKAIELKTVEDIIKVVNEDNLQNFIVDFTNYLAMHMALKNVQEKEKDVDVQVDKTVFQWIDDGKNEINLKIKS